MCKSINGVFFSATDNTKDAVSRISNDIADIMQISEVKYYDFTLTSSRKNILKFDSNDIVVLGVPVYAGRVPNLLVKFLESIIAYDALCIPIVTFGNRDFDDALIELATIMESVGFNIMSAGAFVYPHSFSNILASKRPDEKDMISLKNLSYHAVLNINQFYENKLKNIDLEGKRYNEIFDIDSIKGQKPYRQYFKPVDKNGDEFEFRKIKPHTFNNCIKCNICVELCPMDSIDKNNPKVVSGKCIKCCACIKCCPLKAKEFIDENYVKHKEELEELVDYRQEAYICY